MSQLSQEAMKVLKEIGDWYLDERSTYIWVSRAIKEPNTLLAHVPNILVLKEIAYRTTVHGFDSDLSSKN